MEDESKSEHSNSNSSGSDAKRDSDIQMDEEQLLLAEQFLLDTLPSTTDNVVQNVRMDPRIEVSDHEGDKELCAHG